MFHIESLSWDDGDSELWSKLERQAQQERRHDPCDDDYETKCPFVGMLPEESGKEDGSPLNFGMEQIRAIDRQIQQALMLGI